MQWLRTVHTYDVDKMRKTLKEAFTSDFNGLKVIIAEGECQLERQRRIKPWIASLLKSGERVVRVKYGVDEDVCNGDHACIRLSGCPTLTIKDNPDPLKVDPVATVIDGCVGCGLCGENAHAATLCPSFYRAEVVQNPKWHERLLRGLRGARRARCCNRHEATMTTRNRKPITLLICALGGEGGGVLDRMAGRDRAPCRLRRAEHLDPRRRAAHRRHHLLRRGLPGAAGPTRRPAAGVQPEPGAGRAGRARLVRTAGDRAPDRQRHERARAHPGHHLVEPAR